MKLTEFTHPTEYQTYKCLIAKPKKRSNDYLEKKVFAMC